MSENRPRIGSRSFHWLAGGVVVLALLALAWGSPADARRTKPRPGPGPTPVGHHGVTTYEGSKTCNQCHLDKAKEVYASEHFQWKGKLGAINDFCTYPDVNWLFNFPVNSTAAAGCATCHAGFGDIKPPFPSATSTDPAVQTAYREALDKIDCLMCHSESYNHVGQMAGSTAVLAPDKASADNMPAILAGISKTPSKAACLKCHAKAGGGDGIKQGDMDLALANPDFTLDVHMSASGANFNCVSCHKAANHKIAGKGADLRVADATTQVSCTNCHGTSPHAAGDLNEHVSKLNCTVCHIPSFARSVPTELNRNNELPEILNGKYEGKRTLAGNVTPKLLRYDGKSYFYPYNSVLSLKAPDGNFLIAGPTSVQPGASLGSGAKYHPFKVHTARMAVDVQNRLVGVKAQTFWSTGDIEGAAKFVNTTRYLALYHQVAPKSMAYNACVQCHKNGIPD